MPLWAASSVGYVTIRQRVTTAHMESVRVLAKHGAKIIFSARDLAAGEKVVANIKAETPTAEITYYKLDLSSLASVKAFADEVKASAVLLNGLILNAGKQKISFYVYV
ncbi:hypothetical protein BC936DRAFT_147400 [Jimgerdemannia flammicorona]|uniref:Uncharacterized protein n=1 Tax=Jimgerdemannia flammicorona TaxID=994334 RepID=A0A433D5J5_9FUNG|nr:hypothetical protein BC936DRAFT_147400 [Jimgerdemannia flammicorona]